MKKTKRVWPFLITQAWQSLCSAPLLFALFLLACSVAMFLPALLIQYGSSIFEQALMDKGREEALMQAHGREGYAFQSSMQLLSTKDLNKALEDAGLPLGMHVQARQIFSRVKNAKGDPQRDLLGVNASLLDSYALLEGRKPSKAEMEEGAPLLLLGKYTPMHVGERVMIQGQSFRAIGRLALASPSLYVPYEALWRSHPHQRLQIECRGFGSYEGTLPAITDFLAKHAHADAIHWRKDLQPLASSTAKLLGRMASQLRSLWIVGGGTIVFSFWLLGLLLFLRLQQRQRRYAIFTAHGLTRQGFFWLLFIETTSLLLPAMGLGLLLLHGLRFHLHTLFYYDPSALALGLSLGFALFYAWLLACLASAWLQQQAQRTGLINP